MFSIHENSYKFPQLDNKFLIHNYKFETHINNSMTDSGHHQEMFQMTWWAEKEFIVVYYKNNLILLFFQLNVHFHEF